MTLSPRRAGAAAALALAFVLQLVAIHRQSLSGDGAYHLVAGHQALRHGQNTTNFEHPPLAKLVLALPLLLENEPLTPPLEVTTALDTSNRVYARGEIVRRATVRGRYVALLLFVLPMFAAAFVLGRSYGGPAAGVLLVLLLALSLDVLPYLTVLQTDAAVTLAFLATFLAASAYVEAPSARRAVLLGVAAGFGLAVKFSALLLGPAVLLAFALAPGTYRRRLGHLLAAALAVVLVVEASYLAANRDYDGEVGRRVIRTYCDNRGTLAVDDALKPWEETLLAVERADPRLAQWLTGFVGVRIQNAIGVYPSFAFGEVRSGGRWWYFPVVLAVKTPLAILLVALWAISTLGARASRPPSVGEAGEVTSRPPPIAAQACYGLWDGDPFGVKDRRSLLIGAIVGVYLLTSLTSSYNLSVRHMLPVLPFLYLPLAVWLARRPRAAATVVAVLALESVLLAPLWMSATNTWWLGEHNPTRFALGAGNLEYRQNFGELARVAEERGLEPLYVLYPALADEVLVPFLPDARLRRPGDGVEPGWYAVNVTVEQMVPALLRASPDEVYNFDELHGAARAWEPFWRSVTGTGEDHGWVAGTFHLYRVEPGRVDTSSPTSRGD